MRLGIFQSHLETFFAITIFWAYLWYAYFDSFSQANIMGLYQQFRKKGVL